jgi:hypothetical protein
MGLTEEQNVTLRVICVQPPDPESEGAEFGMQGDGSALTPGERLADGSFRFTCTLRVRPNPKNGQPNFLGAFAHGTPEARFLYLIWRVQQPDLSRAGRRMKIHLASITWEQIEEALRANGVLEASVQGTGRDGKFACASVPLLGEGWTPAPLT